MVALHLYTTVTAYKLANPGLTQYIAALAAFAFFPISEGVVAYYAWKASGSMVNAYSVWLLAWLVLLFGVASLVLIRNRLGR
jgi:hypothetical protein